MFQHLNLQRPLAVLDLETTGVDPQRDRIVEISILRFTPPDIRQQRTQRVNPGVSIPSQATAVHGISDSDVADAPTFHAIAADLLEFLNGCDLCGYNLKRFDLRMLYAEFERAGLVLNLEGRAIIDPMQIFHHFERRDLSAAVEFYVGRVHENGHASDSDVAATVDVLEAMMVKYADLPRSVKELHNMFVDPNAVDLGGRITRIDESVHFCFGKYRGQSVDSVARSNPE